MGKMRHLLRVAFGRDNVLVGLFLVWLMLFTAILFWVSQP